MRFDTTPRLCEITPYTLKKAHDLVMENQNYQYGQNEERIISRLEKLPYSDDLSKVEEKIRLINSTNSTRLSNVEIRSIAIIINSEELNFDKRVSEGDPTLVDSILHKLQGQGRKLKSFISKYCVYHNYYVYGKDNYIKYDAIDREILPEYAKFYSIGYSVTKRKLEQESYEYYLKVVNDVLKNALGDKYESTTNKRQCFDSLMWFTNRKETLTYIPFDPDLDASTWWKPIKWKTEEEEMIDIAKSISPDERDNLTPERAKEIVLKKAYELSNNGEKSDNNLSKIEEELSLSLAILLLKNK